MLLQAQSLANEYEAKADEIARRSHEAWRAELRRRDAVRQWEEEQPPKAPRLERFHAHSHIATSRPECGALGRRPECSLRTIEQRLAQPVPSMEEASCRLHRRPLSGARLDSVIR